MLNVNFNQLLACGRAPGTRHTSVPGKLLRADTTDRAPRKFRRTRAQAVVSRVPRSRRVGRPRIAARGTAEAAGGRTMAWTPPNPLRGWGTLPMRIHAP